MTTKSIPNSLKQFRKKRGLKQRDVARILGLKSASIISRWEKGITLPNTVNAFKLALIYRTMSDLMYLDYISEIKEEIQRRERTKLIG